MNSKASRQIGVLAILGMLAVAPLTQAGAHSKCRHATELGAVKEVNGHSVATWTRTTLTGVVQEVGLSIPMELLKNPPSHAAHAEEGGPAGSFVSLPFSERTQQNTYLNHAEVHWNPAGHPPDAFFVPHFDFHFYSIPEAEVRGIGSPDPHPLDADRIPPGYVYPGAVESVPEMGVHMLRPKDMNRKFRATLVMGAYNNQMHFIEPMVTQKFLLQKRSFNFKIPVPQVLGRDTLYPTRLQGHYDRRENAYHIVFSKFVWTGAAADGR